METVFSGAYSGDMTATHPSRSWRGCTMCKPHKRRGAGRAVREPVAVRRALGKSCRLPRGYAGDGW